MDIQSRFKAIFTGVALAAYAATPAIAEDIEIYTTANLGASVIQPNVMFIVDSSGSMGGSKLEYLKREIQKTLKKHGIALASEADESTEGPASLMVFDPDGNPILIDQHR